MNGVLLVLLALYSEVKSCVPTGISLTVSGSTRIAPFVASSASVIGFASREVMSHVNGTGPLLAGRVALVSLTNVES